MFFVCVHCGDPFLADLIEHFAHESFFLSIFFWFLYLNNSLICIKQNFTLIFLCICCTSTFNFLFCTKQISFIFLSTNCSIRSKCRLFCFLILWLLFFHILPLFACKNRSKRINSCCYFLFFNWLSWSSTSKQRRSLWFSLSICSSSSIGISCCCCCSICCSKESISSWIRVQTT